MDTNNLIKDRNERDFAISPNGIEIFYSMVLPGHNYSVILFLHFDGHFWSEPKVANFSGQYSDLEPAFSPDGKKLFFISKRPVDINDTIDDYDIWYIENSVRGWTSPKNIGAPVNTTDGEYYPSITSDGTLYFTARRDSTLGGEDIYFSRFENGKYLPPVNVGAPVNSSFPEFNAFIAPDESYLLFSSYGKDDDLGGGDLYISYREQDKSWTNPRNMGEPINSDKIDYCPFVSPDGKYLFFTSERINPAITIPSFKNFQKIIQLADGVKNGLGNIYWVEFEK